MECVQKAAKLLCVLQLEGKWMMETLHPQKMAIVERKFLPNNHFDRVHAVVFRSVCFLNATSDL